MCTEESHFDRMGHIWIMICCFCSLHRVKQAIVKKEESVSQLKQQHAAAVKRADHLESLLEQQRKQLIKKK